MKILILVSLVSFSVMASNWVPISKIQSHSSQAFQIESDCKSRSQEECLDVGDEPEIVSLGFVTEVKDSYSAQSEIEICDGQEDCQAKLEQKSCEDGQAFIDAEYSKIYCSKYLGKILVKDLAGFAQYKALKAARAQTETLIAMGAKARGDCQRVLDLIGGFNLLPGRTTEQAGEMVASFATAKAALQDGRPGAAKTAIQAIPVDGVLVTQPMKDLALEQLKDW